MAPLNDIINILLKFTKIICTENRLYKEKIIHKFLPSDHKDHWAKVKGVYQIKTPDKGVGAG